MAPVLVIGVGNALREDDGVGPAVAQRVADVAGPEAEVVIVHQLTPELACSVAVASTVVFVDAAANLPPGAVRLTRVPEPDGLPVFDGTHALDAGGVLRLADTCYGHLPREAWMVGIGGESFGYGERLSAAAEAAVGEAARRVLAFLPPRHQGRDRSALRR